MPAGGEPPKSLTGALSLPTSTQHMRVSNKATALRELQRSQKMHLIKLENMKPGIDMTPPKMYPHVQFNAKRQQMEAERNSAIERENKILLGKMYTIMNAEPMYQTMPSATVTSLNMTVRKQEYDRIARENHAIMQRILHREPHFNRHTLDEDWKVTQRYLRNISEFPFILGNLPPATRKRTLKPLEGSGKAGEVEDVEDAEATPEAEQLATAEPEPEPESELVAEPKALSTEPETSAEEEAPLLEESASPEEPAAEEGAAAAEEGAEEAVPAAEEVESQ